MLKRVLLLLLVGVSLFSLASGTSANSGGRVTTQCTESDDNSWGSC